MTKNLSKCDLGGTKKKNRRGKFLMLKYHVAPLPPFPKNLRLSSFQLLLASTNNLHLPTAHRCRWFAHDFSSQLSASQEGTDFHLISLLHPLCDRIFLRLFLVFDLELASPPRTMSGQSTVASSPSDSKLATEPTTSIPELSTYVVTEPEDIRSAHKLIADSVAQQRQLAARAIIFHPIWLGAMVAVFAVVYKLLYHDLSDLPLIGTTGAGCVMAGLTVVRVYTGGYIEHAEHVGTRAWLEGDEDDKDEQDILVTKFGENIIGALIVKGVRDGRKMHGVIRAWTVQQKYRGKGVGMGLLEEVVQLCQKKRWRGPEFDEEHTNAKRVLPGLFNGPFEKRERRAKRALEKLLRKK